MKRSKLSSADGAEAKLHLSNLKRLEKINQGWASREKRLKVIILAAVRADWPVVKSVNSRSEKKARKQSKNLTKKSKIFD